MSQNLISRCNFPASTTEQIWWGANEVNGIWEHVQTTAYLSVCTLYCLLTKINTNKLWKAKPTVLFFPIFCKYQYFHLGRQVIPIRSRGILKCFSAWYKFASCRTHLWVSGVDSAHCLQNLCSQWRNNHGLNQATPSYYYFLIHMHVICIYIQYIWTTSTFEHLIFLLGTLTLLGFASGSLL